MRTIEEIRIDCLYSRADNDDSLSERLKNIKDVQAKYSLIFEIYIGTRVLFN